MISQAQLQRARLDPATVFDRPDDVVAAEGLPREEKLEILRRWRYDAIESHVAADEGMGEEKSALLDRILAAIARLDPGAPDAARPGRRS